MQCKGRDSGSEYVAEEKQIKKVEKVLSTFVLNNHFPRIQQNIECHEVPQNPAHHGKHLAAPQPYTNTLARTGWPCQSALYSPHASGQHPGPQPRDFRSGFIQLKFSHSHWIRGLRSIVEANKYSLVRLWSRNSQPAQTCFRKQLLPTVQSYCGPGSPVCCGILVCVSGHKV